MPCILHSLKIVGNLPTNWMVQIVNNLLTISISSSVSLGDIMSRLLASQINSPIGISEYELAKQQLPKELQDKLPSVEEIEQRLNSEK